MKLSPPLKSLLIGVIVTVLLGGIAFVATKHLRSANPSTSIPTSPVPSPGDFVSAIATHSQLMSQGEKILLPTSNPEIMRLKQTGAQAFAQKSWTDAIANYQQAATLDPNDPESKIYYNNARARVAGVPLTMAVVVPITPDINAAKEVLRGVAQYQDTYNQTPKTGTRLVEVVIVNDQKVGIGPELATDLMNASSVLGVLGHGVDQDSQEAIHRYEQAQLAVVAPINTNLIANPAGQSTLQTLSLNPANAQLFNSYLQKVGETLATHAQKTATPRAVVIFNADSPYSQQLKESLAIAIPKVGGSLTQEIDLSGTASFDAATVIKEATQAGANTIVLALSKNRVDQAIAVARANRATPKPLLLMGGDELYNPTLLVEGSDAIAGIVLAVPWSSQPTDPFATQAIKIWKGQISWRTATAYDATAALVEAMTQASSRSAVVQQLNQGVAVPGAKTGFSLFQKIPLVQAVSGSDGPQGSRYQFETIPE